MRYETEEHEDAARIALDGDLDMSATFTLEPELDRLLDREGVRRLVLDLRGMRFMDSTGLRLLLQTDGRARERDVDLSFVRGAPEVQRVFELAGVADLLPFVDPPGPGLSPGGRPAPSSPRPRG